MLQAMTKQVSAAVAAHAPDAFSEALDKLGHPKTALEEQYVRRLRSMNERYLIVPAGASSGREDILRNFEGYFADKAPDEAIIRQKVGIWVGELDRQIRSDEERRATATPQQSRYLQGRVTAEERMFDTAVNMIEAKRLHPLFKNGCLDWIIRQATESTKLGSALSAASRVALYYLEPSHPRFGDVAQVVADRFKQYGAERSVEAAAAIWQSHAETALARPNRGQAVKLVSEKVKAALNIA